MRFLNFKKRRNEQIELEKLCFLATSHAIQRASVDIMIDALSLDSEQSRVMHEKFTILFESYSESMIQGMIERIQNPSIQPQNK